MLADGNGDFAEALGLDHGWLGFGMGKRGRAGRRSSTTELSTELNVEEPGAFQVSSADFMLGQLWVPLFACHAGLDRASIGRPAWPWSFARARLDRDAPMGHVDP